MEIKLNGQVFTNIAKDASDEMGKEKALVSNDTIIIANLLREILKKI